MPKEVDWQHKLIKEIKRSGGHAKKWATQYTVGAPDLIASVPGVGLFLAEVKLEKDWSKNTTRSIALSPKQRYELNKFRDAGAKVCVLVVVDNGYPLQFVCLADAPYGNDTLSVRRDDVLVDSYRWEQTKTDLLFIDWLTRGLQQL